MSCEGPPLVVPQRDEFSEALQWLAKVLTRFAAAEQAIGELSLAMDLPIKNGLLSSLDEVLCRLDAAQDRRCKSLTERINRWRSLRPVRHLLAHATIRIVFDENYEPLIVTRHLPLNQKDVTPERVWTRAEQKELLRIVSNDGRSIVHQVQFLIQHKSTLHSIRKA